ncbi:MAG: hypothetical protein NDI62_02725 [Burkholderiales bacterium]|nr:hypothetical protein [Burkholderiales bacterium]
MIKTLKEFLKKTKIWKFKNTILLLLSIVLISFFIDTPLVRELFHNIAKLGYWGSFLAGIFFVFIFTSLPAGVILFFLAKELDPFLITLFAGLGAMIGDYLIFYFFKDRVFEEWRPIFNNSRFFNFFSTSYFTKFAPVLGAIIIASPFPDEIGIGLMGLSKIKNWQFLLLSFFLNALGILIITLFGAF